MLMMKQMITDKEIMETYRWYLGIHWLHVQQMITEKELMEIWILFDDRGTHWLHFQQMIIDQEFMEIVGWQGGCSDCICSADDYW